MRANQIVDDIESQSLTRRKLVRKIQATLRMTKSLATAASEFS